MSAFTIWRHPKPRGAEGRCIGARTDLPVDPRKAKRLAHRIRAHARRQGLPREVVTSPLVRAAAVGRWLKCWGFRWCIDPGLAEMDFGRWDGQPWRDIPRLEFERWMSDFCGFDFDGGESVAALLARVTDWQPPTDCRLAVGHSGWMVARHWKAENSSAMPSALSWPAPFRYGQALRLGQDLRPAAP